MVVQYLSLSGLDTGMSTIDMQKYDNLLDMKSRFTGCLLGVTLADSLGALFEWQDSYTIQGRYDNPADLIENAPFHEDGVLYYTDDTQMTIGVAETLLEYGEINPAELLKVFADNFDDWRGYGLGTRKIISSFYVNGSQDRLSESYFSDGSFGNGGAMRVAPVGLFFMNDHDMLWEQAKLSSITTHSHPLGVEGAQLMALAVGVVAKMHTFDRDELFKSLLDRCLSDEYRTKIDQAIRTTSHRDLPALGTDITALDSVITAITCFSLTPESYTDTIGNAIMLGGDTDTIAGMAGALSGVFLGIKSLPERLLVSLEDKGSIKGKAYISKLADLLYQKTTRI